MTPTQQREHDHAKNVNQIRFALQAILVIAIVFSLYFARDFLLPVILALFLALTLRPAVRYLQKWLVPPGVTAAIFVSTLILLSYLAVYMLGPPLSEWIQQAPALQQKFTSKFSGFGEIFKRFSYVTDQIQNATSASADAKVQEVVVREHSLPGMLVSLTSYPLQFVISLAATLVIAVFLLASGDLFYEKLVRILPTLTARKRALHIVYNIEKEVSHYVLMLSAVNAILGIVIASTFYVLGMPLAYLWGLLIFIFNFVPYLGTAAGVILSAFMAVITFDSLSYALLVPLSYIGWSVLESEIVRPQIFGQRFQLNNVAILLALAFWSWLWGIAGAAIAIPALVTLKIFCDNIAALSGLGEFLSSRPYEKTEAEGIANI